MNNKINILLFLCVCSVELMAQNIDVVLIGGQSNATGQGYVKNIPQSFQIDKTVLFYYSQSLNQKKGSDTWQPLCQASETPDKFGVELSLGTSLRQAFPDRKIALIKHALSGSSLYKQWNPGNRAGEKQGPEYTLFLKTVRTALNNLKNEGYTPVIRAMVWQQGEADARDNAGMEQSSKYGENLRNFILQVRKDLSAEDMLFVFGRVIPMKADRFPGRDLVRQAQYDVSEKAATALSIKNAILVEADDLQMRRSDYQTPMPEDDVHLGSYGILNLGERFAQVISTYYK